MHWGLTIGNTYFNSIDIIMFIIMIIGGSGCAITGIIKSLSRISGMIIGFVVGLMFTSPLSMILRRTFSLPQLLCSLIAFVLLFLSGYILVTILGGTLKSIANTCASLTSLDHLLGFFWGFLCTLFILGVICHFLRMQSVFNVDELFSSSQFVTRLLDPLIPRAMNLVKGKFT